MPKNPKEYIVAPKPNDPRLTRKLDGIDHKGNLLTTAVVTEKPLTVFLNGQEIVTLMTIGDEPELLAVGFLLNQNKIINYFLIFFQYHQYHQIKSFDSLSFF